MAPDSIDPHRCALVLLHLSISPQLPRQSLALIRIEPGWVAGLRVFGRAARPFRRREHAADARITRDPLQHGLRRGLDPQLSQHPLVEGSVKHTEAEWAMDQHAEAQLRSQR